MIVRDKEHLNAICRVITNKAIILKWLDKRLEYYKTAKDQPMINSINRLKGSMFDGELNFETDRQTIR